MVWQPSIEFVNRKLGCLITIKKKVQHMTNEGWLCIQDSRMNSITSNPFASMGPKFVEQSVLMLATLHLGKHWEQHRHVI